MAKKGISDIELRAIVDGEIREAMGELSGELADERAKAMDYYHGEPTGKLAVPNSDRSSVVMTTVRDTVEWIMPELMRIFAQADKVVEFEPVGAEDEDKAEQETQALNHVFWRQNSGFLVLYSWFKDALLQKNGTVKYWIEESDKKSREEYDGLTDIKMNELLSEEGVEPLEHEISETKSIDGEPLHHVVFERTGNKKRICVEVILPEELLVSSDCRSINLKEAKPRFIGHYTEKTRSELSDMGFSKSDIDDMARGGGEFIEEWDEEYYARYRLTDEQTHIHGSEPHESQQKIKMVEGYMRLDIDGDDHAELVRIWRAGDFCESETCDQAPFASLTPNILTHKFYGMSIADQVTDLQEIATAVMRQTLDNLYLNNNVRPVVNDRVDLDSLLTTRPGAPIHVEDSQSVQDAITSFSPPPMWADGLQLMEWLEGVRKDRTGVGDEVQGLDPKTLAQANTGVVMQALESARAKTELIARIFAETGVKWLFQGMHELARKSYDQPLRYKLSNDYIEVNPQEWMERDDITVNVGTATGSEARELAALEGVTADQAAMIQAGGLGITVIPSNVYETAIAKAKARGIKNPDKYFFDPQLRSNPEVMKIVQAQMPQQQDQSAGLIQAQMQIEQGKAQVTMQKAQMEAKLKEAELLLKREELGVRSNIEDMKQQMSMTEAQGRNATELEKANIKAATDRMKQTIETAEAQWSARLEAQSNAIDKYLGEISSLTSLEKTRMEIASKELEVSEKSADVESILSDVGRLMGELRKEVAKPMKMMADMSAEVAEIKGEVTKPKTVERDADGRVTTVGGRKVQYDKDGSIKQIG